MKLQNPNKRLTFDAYRQVFITAPFPSPKYPNKQVLEPLTKKSIPPNGI
jgi:hypothetical protein